MSAGGLLTAMIGGLLLALMTVPLSRLSAWLDAKRHARHERAAVRVYQ